MSLQYTPTIGLEIHAELHTKSKMFCGCENDPDNHASNTLICPICMAHPGTLPVINMEAVRQVLRVGRAVGGMLADFTEFDRKNYFYPDIPKGYQISQYQYPLVTGGNIGPVEITRIHLEEDTARSAHNNDTSSVDFNRAGVPLMELVTEPVIHDAETAVSFARDLRLCLKYLGASEANLDKGEMRIEANISVAHPDASMGTKVEVKNLNSFKAVEQAIAYEIKRQIQTIESGGKVVQETRGWDENKQKTFSQRLKESSHDYRYFPDPDLPKLYVKELHDLDVDTISASLPILPWDLRARYIEGGLAPQIADLLVGNQDLCCFYEAVIQELEDESVRRLAVNYLSSDLLGIVGDQDYKGPEIAQLVPAQFAELVKMIHEGIISSRGAKDVLATWVRDGGNTRDIAKKLNILQISNEKELQEVITRILAEHVSVVTEYKAGKEQALQYLVGQCMKATKGAANPTVLKKMLAEGIASGA